MPLRFCLLVAAGVQGILVEGCLADPEQVQACLGSECQDSAGCLLLLLLVFCIEG